MKWVVDASVALKWVLPEPGSLEARAMIGRETLIAPEFLLLECANVLSRDARRGLISVAQATEAYAALELVSLYQHPIRPNVKLAYQLALQLGRTDYDCLYLALALQESAMLITADRRFATKASAVYPANVQLLPSV